MLTVAIPIPVPEEVPLEHATIPTPASDKLDNKKRRAQNLLFICSFSSHFRAALASILVYFFLTKTERTGAQSYRNSNSIHQKHQQEKGVAGEIQNPTIYPLTLCFIKIDDIDAKRGARKWY